MKREKITCKLPAWSIVVLVNGDTDTVTDTELTTLNQFLIRNGLNGCPMSVVSEEPYFSWKNDVDGLGGDCCDVIFLRPAAYTKRKTVDCFEIWANYGAGPESVTGAENHQDARRLLKEYRENEPGTYHWIKTVRVPNPNYIPTPFERILCPVNCAFGAPMGRPNTIPAKHPSERIFDRAVHFIDGDYDRGGAYWGGGRDSKPLRVRYTRSLSYVEFYRVGDTPKHGTQSEAIKTLRDLKKSL